MTKADEAGRPAALITNEGTSDIARVSRDELETRFLRLQAIVDLSPMAIWIAEGDRIAYANDAAARLVGAPSGAAMAGTSIYALVHADGHGELRQQLEQTQVHRGRLDTLLVWLVRADGAMREVQIGLGALPDHGNTSVQMVLHDVTEERQVIRDLEASRRRLRRLSSEVVEAREEERQRIARELHDELGQALTAMKIDIVHAGDRGGLQGDPPSVVELLARLDEIMASVRRIAADLRPPMLDDLGLSDAIEALANDFSRRQCIEVHLHLDDLGTSIDERVAIALYRMVQEALTNVARHARATRVSIELVRQGDLVALEVHDNGVGFPDAVPDAEGHRFGVLGMEERAAMLGGTCQSGNEPEGGACIRVRMPIRYQGQSPRGRSGRMHAARPKDPR